MNILSSYNDTFHGAKLIQFQKHIKRTITLFIRLVEDTTFI